MTRAIIAAALLLSLYGLAIEPVSRKCVGASRQLLTKSGKPLNRLSRVGALVRSGLPTVAVHHLDGRRRNPQIAAYQQLLRAKITAAEFDDCHGCAVG
jgi:hypothetical protein